MAKKVATQAKRQFDVRIENHGSVFLVTPLSLEAQEWIDQNVETESWQWMGRSLGVEWRFADMLANEMTLAGLEVLQ